MKKRFKSALVLSLLVWAYDCSAMENLHGLMETPEELLSNMPVARLDQSIEVEDRSFLSMTPIKQQGRLGTCASFAAGGCVEYYVNRQSPEALFSASEAEFTVHAERFDDCRFGINLGKALVIAQQDGFIDEDYWSYEDFLARIPEGSDNACIRYPSGLNRNAVTHYKIKTLAKLHSSSRSALAISVRQSLREPLRLSTASRSRGMGAVSEESSLIKVIQKCLYGYETPIALSIPIFDEIAWKNPINGIIPMPSSALVERELDVLNSPFDRWHAVVLTGYDRQSGYLRFRNSWGEDWGDEGSGWLPNSYIKYATDIIVTQGAVIEQPKKPVFRVIPQVPHVLPSPVAVTAYYARPGLARRPVSTENHRRLW